MGESQLIDVSADFDPRKVLWAVSQHSEQANRGVQYRVISVSEPGFGGLGKKRPFDQNKRSVSQKTTAILSIEPDHRRLGETDDHASLKWCRGSLAANGRS